MKRSIIICSVCFTMTGLFAGAQNKKTTKPPPPPPPPIAAMAVPPPPPPPPPVMEDKMDVNTVPVAPIPPLPPVPPSIDRKEGLVSPVIINENGYEISIQKIKDDEIVYVRKKGDTQKIKMSTWKANEKYYEKKYGMLPSPPPPIMEN